MKEYRIRIEGRPDDYVMGRISGIVAALTFDETGKREHHGIIRHWDDDGNRTHHTLVVVATEDEYELIKKVIGRVINTYYTNLCTFK